MGLKEFMVIDEKGVDISSMHQDEIVNNEPKKHSFVRTVFLLIDTFRHLL